MDPETNPSTLQEKKSPNSWKETAKLFLIALIIVIPFRLYIAQPFIVEGASMEPTFDTGDYLIVDELTYHFQTPERGSVLIFKYPRDTRKSFIKRVIGLPGETININDGVVTITSTNGQEDITLDEPYILSPKNEDFTITLGSEEYFVMGDNRLGSSDSRIWGPVPEDNIVGRPIFQFLPPRLFPGDQSNT